MKDIVICTSSRSERQLQQALIDAFGDKCEVWEIPSDFHEAYECVRKRVELYGYPKVAFCNFDRIEMLGAATAFWISGIKVAQYHAGDKGVGKCCFDDTVRNMVTLLSALQFCNGDVAFARCRRILYAAEKSPTYCFEVGSMALDGITPDYSKVPKEPFDVIVYNPPNKDRSMTEAELRQIESMLDKPAIWIAPNEDDDGIVESKMRALNEIGKVYAYNTLPRAQYLALLEKADRVIGNSSSFFLELPAFGKKHIHIGERNKEREYASSATGASARIAEIVVKLIEGGMLEHDSDRRESVISENTGTSKS